MRQNPSQVTLEAQNNITIYKKRYKIQKTMLQKKQHIHRMKNIDCMSEVINREIRMSSRLL